MGTGFFLGALLSAAAQFSFFCLEVLNAVVPKSFQRDREFHLPPIAVAAVSSLRFCRTLGNFCQQQAATISAQDGPGLAHMLRTHMYHKDHYLCFHRRPPDQHHVERMCIGCGALTVRAGWAAGMSVSCNFRAPQEMEYCVSRLVDACLTRSLVAAVELPSRNPFLLSSEPMRLPGQVRAHPPTPRPGPFPTVLTGPPLDQRL